MAQKDLITVSSNPKIPLKELWASDDSTESIHNSLIVPSSGVRSSKESIGSDLPFVKINSIPISDIDQLIIDETGIIPKIKLIFTDMNGSLSGPSYPKNDPIVSVYIKTQNDKFKPIRCDFLITRIKTNQDAILGADTIDNGATFIMTGELYIPKIYENVSRSYTNMNSKDTLRKIAEETDLGFASNDFTTEDRMTWLNTNKSSLKFIEHVSKHSYLDDDSFFTSFIDKYYHLTFVNIAEQLNQANAYNMTYANTVDASEFDMSQNNTKDRNKDMNDILNISGLTNNDLNRGKPEYIINYSLMGDIGSILKSKGFKKQIFYYDTSLDDNKFTSFYVNPIIIKGYETGTNKGLEPEDETLREAVIKKWMNIDYGNAHPEWNASVLINDQNNSELNKVKLKVETAGVNFQVTRGQSIPVMMYLPNITTLERGIKIKGKNVDAKSEFPIDANTLVPDGILSGKYYVSGVRYIYDKLDSAFPFKTEFQLARVNWHGEKNTVEDAS